MNRRWLFISGIFIVGISAMTYWWYPENEEPVKEVPTVNELPLLNVLKIDGRVMSLREAEDKSVLIFFNPDCDHCQREAKDISEQKNVFRDYTLYFISIDSIPKIKQFAREYDLMEDNFIFAQADNYQVYVAVGAFQAVPAIFIYEKKKLVKKTEGEIKLDELKKYLN